MRQRVRAWAGSRSAGLFFAAHASLPAAQPAAGGNRHLAGKRAGEQERHACCEQHQPHQRRARRVLPSWNPHLRVVRALCDMKPTQEERRIYSMILQKTQGACG
jgi:hypothetical protein